MPGKKCLRMGILALSIAALSATAGAAAIGQVGATAWEWTDYKGIDGNTYSLKDYQGKVVFLFVLYYNCGGCKGDAPKMGQIAYKYQGPNFQAFGVEVNPGTYASLLPGDMTFSQKLTSLAPKVNFPILIGIPDSDRVHVTLGNKWTRYDALRDVFFVIGKDGKIVHRTDGNRANAMPDTGFVHTDAAIAAALASTTVNDISLGNRNVTLTASRTGSGFRIDLENLNRGVAGASLRILDAQGRLVKDLSSEVSGSGPAIFWNGLDARGGAVNEGVYFLALRGAGLSLAQPLTWTP